MLRKTLMIAACFCFLAAPMAMAQSTNAQPAASAGQQATELQGFCHSGRDGGGEIIPFAKSESQCFQQAGGLSWGRPGQADNNVVAAH